MAGNWYPHYPGDYARKTGHLSLVEHGAYRTLLDHYYATATPLPTDVERTLRVCRATSAVERAAVLSVLKEFFVEDADGWHHARADEELKKAAEKREKCASAGQKSATKRQRTFNGRSTDVGTDASTERPTEGQPTTTTTTNNPSLRSGLPKRGRTLVSLPDDCPTQEDRDAALEFWRDRGRNDLCERLGDEVQAFRDHHRAHASRMAVWPAAWRTWCRHAMKFNRNQSNEKRSGGSRTATDQHLDGIAEAIRSVRAGG